MKKLLLTFLGSVATFVLFAQSIKAEDAAKHIGENVTICGKMFGGKFLDRSDKQLTLLNLGAAYPNSPITIKIEGDDRKKFDFKPEEFYLDKDICVTGMITEFKGKPELQVKEASQIKVSDIKPSK